HARGGLPAAVWKSGKPAWLPLFQPSGAAASGVRKARHLQLAFPVALGEEILGVLQFWGPAGQEPDEDVLETLSNVGNQLGLFLQRKRAEQAVSESEARKRAVLDAALDAIVTLDQGGLVVDFNPAAEGIFRRSRSDALGRELAELA